MAKADAQVAVAPDPNRCSTVFRDPAFLASRFGPVMRGPLGALAMRKKRTGVGIALVTFAGVGVLALVLLSDLGIFLIGNKFWMARAVAAADVRETDAHLRRVLTATQYGVNQAENYVLSLDDRAARVRLWRRLVHLAPNQNWRDLYSYRLQAEYGKGPHAAAARAR